MALIPYFFRKERYDWYKLFVGTVNANYMTIFTVSLQGESRFIFLVVKEFSASCLLPLLITESNVEIRKMESQMIVYFKYENISF